MNAQALAERWARLENEKGALDQRVRKAQNEFDIARSQMEGTAQELVKCVGQNVPTKAFIVDDAVVLVDLKNGIRSLRIEKD